jgi:tripartite-type tricarboxylate transporter receptor subunit TctC
MTSTRLIALAASVLLGPGLAGHAAAQASYPKQAIKLIVPFTPGSGTDVIGRTVADKMSASMGQPVITENKPGAGGSIGAAQVAKSTPDGYTVLIHSAGHVVNPALYANLPFNPLKDLTGVTALATLPNVLVVGAGSGFKNVQELVAQAKAKPDSFNYASAGVGSATHMNAEKFRVAAGLKATHVPFKGTPEALTETLTGRVDWFFAPVVSAMPLIKDGKLKPLAVGSPKRSAILPEVPTTVEAGVLDSDYLFWVGMLVPANTPKEIVARLNAEAHKALASKDVQERLEKLGAEAMPMTPAQFNEFIQAEAASVARLVKTANIKAD